MKIDMTRNCLYWETQKAYVDLDVGNQINFNTFKNGIEELLYRTEICSKLISNIDKYSDEEFYNLLLSFAYIKEWDENDYYNVLGLAYNLKFIGDTVIKTSMHYNVQKSEGHGNNFSWWDEDMGIDLKVLYTEGFEVDEDHVYTVDEIKKLLDDKKIIILCEEERDFDFDEDSYEHEEYFMFDYAYEDYNIYFEFFGEEGKYYKYTLKYIRSMVGKKELLKIYKEYLNYSIKEINEIKSLINDSSIGEEYTKRLEKLNDLNNE